MRATKPNRDNKKSRAVRWGCAVLRKGVKTDDPHQPKMLWMRSPAEAKQFFKDAENRERYTYQVRTLKTIKA